MANEIHTLINLRHENKLLCEYGDYDYLKPTVRISSETWDMFIDAIDQLAKIQDILCPE